MYGARIADSMPMKLNMPNAVAVICGGALVAGEGHQQRVGGELAEHAVQDERGDDERHRPDEHQQQDRGDRRREDDHEQGLAAPDPVGEVRDQGAAGTDVHAVSDETKPVSVAGTRAPRRWVPGGSLIMTKNP